MPAAGIDETPAFRLATVKGRFGSRPGPVKYGRFADDPATQERLAHD